MLVIDVLRAVKIAAGLDSNFKVNKIIIRDGSACTVYDSDNYKLYDSGLDVVLGIADYVNKEVSEYIIDTDAVIIMLED